MKTKNPTATWWQIPSLPQEILKLLKKQMNLVSQGNLPFPATDPKLSLCSQGVELFPKPKQQPPYYGMGRFRNRNSSLALLAAGTSYPLGAPTWGLAGLSRNHRLRSRLRL